MRPPKYSGISLQRYFVQLYAISVLPLMLVAAWLAFQNVQAVHQAQDREATQIAHNLASTIDQRLYTTVQALTAMAQSASLDVESRWPLVYQEAMGLKSAQGMNVVILDAAPPYRMRMSTLVPFSSALPQPPQAEGFQAVPAAIETRSPAVGDAVINAFTQRSSIAVVVPAVRQGRVIHAVLSPLDVAEFQDVLDAYSLPAGWAITLFDGTGQPLAVKRPEGFVPADDMGLAGRAAVVSSLARWSVVLQVPQSARQAVLRETGGALALLVLAATLAGVWAGWIGSKRVGRAVASLTETPSSATDLGITEIHNAKTSLHDAAERERLSEARFRRLFHDAPIGMRLTDESGHVLAQNAAFDAAFGYTRAEAPTLHRWRELVYPDPMQREQIKQVWQEVASGKRQTRQEVSFDEFELTAKDGRRRVVQVRSSLLIDDGLLTSYTDVTEPRQAEARLRLWAEAFKHAELQLAIADPVTNTIVDANPAFARARGYTQEEMAGMPIVQMLPPENRGRLKATLEAQQQVSHFVFEGEHLRKDGSRFPVATESTALHDENGQPISRLTYAVDLTERKRAEAEIKALHETLERRVVERTAQLSRANLELDSFAYTVSHDLRAPLRAMDGYLHLLREELGPQLPEQARLDMDKIAAAILRMKDLIEGILTLTHSARHDLQLAPVNISDLVSARLNELAIAEPDRQVGIDIQPGLMAVADARMLDLVVSNLVSNAWKYTAKTAVPNIRFFSHQQKGQTWFCLADNGAGFDAAHASKLFEPFQRMHRHDEFPGIGIGLATVRRIVQRHGGDIAAEAHPNEGACFRFTLGRSQAL